MSISVFHQDSQSVPDHPPNPWVPPIDGSKLNEQHQKPLNEPNYTITHHDNFSMLDFTYSNESTLIRRPKKLVVSVELPGVVSFLKAMQKSNLNSCL